MFLDNLNLFDKTSVTSEEKNDMTGYRKALIEI
jgi:hypothetical protein